MIVYGIAAKLPSIDVLRSRCQSLAVLERIIDTGEPYYTYTRAWGADEAAFMRNGSGDEWAVIFGADGAFIRVFDHESAMSPYGNPDRELWPGLLEGLPAVFSAHAEEPAFGNEDGDLLATAVLWRLRGDDRWQAAPNITFPASRGPYDTGPDGSDLLEILLDDIADQYIAFAEDYYELPVDRNAVEHILQQLPLTDAVVRSINPDATLEDVRAAIAATGYPVAPR